MDGASTSVYGALTRTRQELSARRDWRVARRRYREIAGDRDSHPAEKKSLPGMLPPCTFVQQGCEFMDGHRPPQEVALPIFGAERSQMLDL